MKTKSALLYPPPRRLRTWVAFCVAIAIHCAAIAIAGLNSDTKVYDDLEATGVETIIGEDISSTEVDSGPPQIDESPSDPIQDQTFVEEEQLKFRPTTNKIAVPIARHPQLGTQGASVPFDGNAMVSFAPRPEYPYDARRQKITGSGVAMIRIDSTSGEVIDVSMLQSTGSVPLDRATIAGMHRWRFKPGTASRIRCPITFTLTGAAY